MPSSKMTGPRLDTRDQTALPLASPSEPGFEYHGASPRSPVKRRPQKLNAYASPPHANVDLMILSVASAGFREPPSDGDRVSRDPTASLIYAPAKFDQLSPAAGAPLYASNSDAIHTSAQSGRSTDLAAAAVHAAAAVTVTPPQGSELFDAIVQAADPRHPDHSAWKERYGSIATRSSRSSFSSQARRERPVALGSNSGGSQAALPKPDDTTTDAASRKRDSLRSVRRTRPIFLHTVEPQDSDADDISDPSDDQGDASGSVRDVKGGPSGSESSLRLARTNSTGSASRTRRRRRATEKTKIRAPPLPIPPPRVTSSTRWQATFGSPLADQPAHFPLPDSQEQFRDDSSEAKVGLVRPDCSYNPEPAAGAVALLRLEHEDRRPMHHPSPLVSGNDYTAANANATQYAGPASSSSLSYSTYGGSIAHSHTQSNATSPSTAAFSPSASMTTKRTDSEAAAMEMVTLPVEEVDRKPRIRTKTLEKGFFTFPRSIFPLKASLKPSDTSTRPLQADSPSLAAAPPPSSSTASRDSMTGRQKSISKIHQVLGSEAPEPIMPNHARKASMQIPRVPVPSLHPLQEQAQQGKQSMDAARTLDSRVFPVRRDEEFQEFDEFETSDSDAADGMDVDPNASFLSPSSRSPNFRSPSFRSPGDANGQVAPGARVPGVVRRSLDSVISPFRAGLVANAKSGRRGPLESLSQASSPLMPSAERQSMDVAVEGRRSMSESRMIRPFLRHRWTKTGSRPLSRVPDGPEPHKDETLAEDAQERPAPNGARPTIAIHDHEAEDRATPKSAFAAAEGRQDHLLTSLDDAPDGLLLPAAEVCERRPDSRIKADEGGHSKAANPERARREVLALQQSSRRASHQQGSNRTKSTKGDASPSPSGGGQSGYTDLTPEEKIKILAENTYFLPTRESRSRPSSSCGLPVSYGNDAPPSESQHSGALHDPLASASSCRSLASSHNPPPSFSQMPASSSINDASFDSYAKQSATPTSQSRGRFAGLISRVKGSLTPGKTPPSVSYSTFTSPYSFGVTTPGLGGDANTPPSLDASQSGQFANLAASSPTPAATGSPAGLGFQYELEDPSNKQDRPRRIRARSLASARKKNKPPGVNSPEDFASFLSSLRPGDKVSTQDEDWRRKLLSEAVGISFGTRTSPKPAHAQLPSFQHSDLQTAPQPPCDQSPDTGGRAIGKILRKKRTAENLDQVIQSFVATAGKPMHLEVAEEAAPRPSMSSARGFTITGAEEEHMLAVGGMLPTIRKTLSPALLSEIAGNDRESPIEEEFGEGSPTYDAEAPDETTEVLQSKTSTPRIDETEVLAERDEDNNAVQAPMRRFIRRLASIDRLSRVEEMSIRASMSADSIDNYTGRPSISVPISPMARSFGEHRQVRRSISGTLHPPITPKALELVDTNRYEYGKRSMDVSRLRNLSEIAYGSQQARLVVSDSSSVEFQDSRSPKKMSFGESLSPSWSRPSFNLQRNGRTSFSQDRDRAPVASPLSPPKNYGSKSPALIQAMKNLRVPGKRSKSFGKGIGPGDIVIPNFDDYDCEDDDNAAFDGVRPSMSLARPSMSASRPSMSASRPSMSASRPSMSASRPSMNLARPSVHLDRQGANTSGAGRSSLASAEMMTRLLEVHADAMVSTPVTATFPSEGGERSAPASLIDSMASETDGSVYTAAEYSTDGMVGLGLGSLADMSNASRPSLSASVSSGDLRGLKNSDSQSNNLLKTPDVAAANANGNSGFVYVAKTPELIAFEDMLGKFGQREKALLKDISARVGTTPHLGSEAARCGESVNVDVAKASSAGSGNDSSTSCKKEAGEDVVPSVH
ncbi:hypothetical protein ACQY0O_006179 [Thecaphora frezii]